MMSQLHVMSWAETLENIFHAKKNLAHFTNIKYLWWKRQWYKTRNNLFNPLYTNHNYDEILIKQIVNP